MPGFIRDAVAGPVDSNRETGRGVACLHTRCDRFTAIQSMVGRKPRAQGYLLQRAKGGAPTGTPPHTDEAANYSASSDAAENAASNDCAGRSHSSERTNPTASAAPCNRSMPASSHSIEIGPV